MNPYVLEARLPHHLNKTKDEPDAECKDRTSPLIRTRCFKRTDGGGQCSVQLAYRPDLAITLRTCGHALSEPQALSNRILV